MSSRMRFVFLVVGSGLVLFFSSSCGASGWSDSEKQSIRQDLCGDLTTGDLADISSSPATLCECIINRYTDQVSYRDFQAAIRQSFVNNATNEKQKTIIRAAFTSCIKR